MKSAPRPRFEVEDLDIVERRRQQAKDTTVWKAVVTGKGRRKEETVYRYLLGYLRAHRAALVVALLLSNVAAVVTVMHIFIVTRVLETILAPTIQGPYAPLLQLCHGVATQAADLSGWVHATVNLLVITWGDIPPARQLGLAISLFLVLVLFAQANEYAHKLIMRRVSLDIVRDIRASVFEQLVHLSVRFHLKNPSGKLVSRITHDLNKLGEAIVDVTVVSLQDLFILIYLFAYLTWIGGGMILAGFLVGAVSFYPIQRLSLRIRRKEHDSRRKMGTLYNSIGEVLSAQKVVKAYGAEKHEAARFRKINENWTKARMKAIAIKTRTGPLVEVAGALGLGLIVWYGGMRVINGVWSAPEFMAILLVLVKLIGSMRRLGMLNNRVQTGIASADRVATVLYAEQEITNQPGAVELADIGDGIELRSVSFGYEADVLVLKDISLRVPRGGSLAIVGPTGSGKSTISDLLPRFFDPEEGDVLIGGRNIREYTVESLRRNIAMVTQDTILFQDTIAANIAYARPDTPMERIIEAAKAAHAHDFIEAMPDGYQTLVGERGMTLSGGERQRLAIARALLRDAPILVLDEATSALDSQAEKIVQEAIDTLKQGRTTVTIAHRLSTIRDAEQIAVIANGRIAERGSHAELLAADGLYARMWNAQNQQ